MATGEQATVRKVISVGFEMSSSLQTDFTWAVYSVLWVRPVKVYSVEVTVTGLPPLRETCQRLAELGSVQEMEARSYWTSVS